MPKRPAGSVGRSIAAVVDEVWHCPMAVLMVMAGAMWSRLMMSPEDMKKCPLATMLAMAVQLRGTVDAGDGLQTS